MVWLTDRPNTHHWTVALPSRCRPALTPRTKPTARVPTAVDGTWNLEKVLGGRYRVRAWKAPDLVSKTEIVFIETTPRESFAEVSFDGALNRNLERQAYVRGARGGGRGGPVVQLVIAGPSANVAVWGMI